MAPLQSQILFGTLIVAGGLFGLAYYAATWRDTVQDGLIKKIDLEDRIWYAFLPVGGYLLETASGVMLALGLSPGWPILATTMGILLISHPQCVGYHRLEHEQATRLRPRA
jgi:hypothetical protein